MIRCRYHRNRRASGSAKRRLCKRCYARWYNKHVRPPERAKARHLMKRYGLTIEQFHKLWKSQGEACAICKLPVRKPHVDHDHKTGRVRGILCHRCNLGLGLFVDSITSLRTAIKYLRVK